MLASAKGRISCQQYRTPIHCHTLICYRTTIHDRRAIRADPTSKMDIRKPFSRLKKKVKRLGSKLKPGRTGAAVDGESVDPDGPFLQPGPQIVADDGEGNGADAGGQQTGLMDQPPQLDGPELVQASGSENDQGGGEADVDGRKVSLMYSRPQPDLKVGMESGPDRGDGANGEGDKHFHSSSSTPSIPHIGEPNSMSYKLLPYHSLRKCRHDCS